MCANLAFVSFVINLLMDIASGAPTMKEQEISLKLRLMVPDAALSQIATYPGMMNAPTSSISNPLFDAYRSIQPPQPPAPPMPPLNIRIQPSSVLTQQVSYEANPVNRWGGRWKSRSKTPVVIHQPVVNYHYSPAYVPPTRLVPIHVPVPTPTPMRPTIILSGFNYSVNSGYSSRGSGKALVDLAEILKEIKEGVDDKAKNCPCNGTNKELDFSTDQLLKKNKSTYYIGKLNVGDTDDDDEDDDDYDIDDLPAGRIARIVLRDALKESRSQLRKAAESERLKRRRIRKGNEALLKQFQNGVNALQKTIKAHENKGVKNAIKDSNDSSFDDLDDNEEDESHLTHFVDFAGKRVLEPQNDVKDKDQTVQESAAVYNNKNPHEWNLNYTKNLSIEDDSHLKVLGYTNASKDEERQEGQRGSGDDMGESVAANDDKHVRNNGTRHAKQDNPAGIVMPHVFNESVANERSLVNPKEKNDAYEEMVNFFKGMIPQRDSISETKPHVLGVSDVSKAAPVNVNSGETRVKDMLVVLIKKKEREGNAKRAGEENEMKLAETAGREGETEYSVDSVEEKDEKDNLSENTNIPENVS